MRSASATELRSLRRYAWLVVACAVAVAAAHVVVTLVQLHVFHRFTWTSRDFAWMAPLAYLALFGAIALAAAPFQRARETVIGTFAAWSLLLLWTTLHPLAAALLSVGAGRALALLWARLSVRQLQTVSGCILALCALAAVQPWLSSRSTVKAGNTPNVLLLILDTVGAKHLSLYGYPRPTAPNLERMAKTSLVFDNAFATSSWSLPSHTGILTGLLPHESGGSYMEPIRREVRSVAQVLQSHGYTTGGFTANIAFAGYHTGLARGFDHFEDFPRSLEQVLVTTTASQTEAVRLARANLKGGYLRGAVLAFRPRNWRLVGVRAMPIRPAADVIQRFQRWRAATTQPFFAFINLTEAHSPYEPPEPFRSRWGAKEVDRYHGAIAYLDSMVAALIATLPGNTIVVVTSDHGEQWGENGFDGHGNTLYLPALRVPLLIRAPKLAAGRVARPVSLRDLPNTMLDLAGFAPILPGHSLREVTPGPIYSEATQGKNVDRSNQTYDGPIRSVLDSAGHYLRFASGREEFYAWPGDMDEGENLAARPEASALLAPYRAAFESIYVAPRATRARSNSGAR
ncbi:MAG: sulfatase [Gemmatimonadaceae bacterium]